MMIPLKCTVVAHPRYLELEGTRPVLTLLVYSKAGYRSVHLFDSLAQKWRDTLVKGAKVTIYGDTEDDSRKTEIIASHVYPITN